MAKTTVTIGEFILNVLSAEQFAAAVKAGEIDPNQMYLTPEKQLVVAVSEDEYEAMKAAGTLDDDVLYVTVTEQTTIAEATETTAGLMPPASMKKLNGIDEGANKYTHPSHTARASGLYKITVDSLGHVTAVAKVEKTDITALGIPGSDTTYSLASAYKNGLMSPAQYSKLSGIESEANKTTVDSTLSGTSANPVQNKVLYVALPWEYYATFYVDSWTTASTDEQAQGFAYKQTVYPSKKISVAPTLTANSMFLSLGSTNKTGVFATDVILADSMDKINAGLVYTGSGTITALVEEKPSSDVVMNWWLRT
jgi:hypothetical protein